MIMLTATQELLLKLAVHSEVGITLENIIPHTADALESLGYATIKGTKLEATKLGADYLYGVVDLQVS